ncbi:MAG: hypothetical protein ACI9GW_000147 [Halieaceae bacterium]|jgi:hypothetical protein
MSVTIRRLCRAIALATLFSLTSAVAETKAKVYPLTPVDKRYIEQQRERVDNIARSELGRQLSQNKQTNLEILQTLLDRRLIKPDQTLELQAMGAVLGNELAREMSMHWVIVEDRYGRSRALQLDTNENFLFPMTMISRRVEAGAKVSVQSIYDKAVGIITPLRKPMPFQ